MTKEQLRVVVACCFIAATLTFIIEGTAKGRHDSSIAKSTERIAEAVERVNEIPTVRSRDVGTDSLTIPGSATSCSFDSRQSGANR